MTRTRSARIIDRAALVAIAILGSGRALAAPAPVPSEVEAKVKAAVQRWVDAQNTGDFAAYSKLYSPRFVGIRRSGSRVVELDQAGWLRDRERMFKRKMHVSHRLDAVSLVKSPAGGSQIAVRIEQIWRSGRYVDRGQKLLVLEEGDGGIQLVREEMLTSELVPARTREVLWDGLEDFIPMFAGHPYLFLGAYAENQHGKFPEDAWATGPIRQEWNRKSYRRLTSRAVDPDRLPAEVRTWIGRQVVLFDAAGEKCRTAIAGLRIASQTSAEAEEKPAGRRTLPATAWDEEDDHYQSAENRPHVLLAEVALATACKGSEWARPADRPAPTVRQAVKPTRAMERLALAAFRGLSAFRKAQDEYAQQVPLPRPEFWDAHKGASASQRRVRWIPPGAGQPALVVVSADIMSCGNGPSASLWALFEVQEADGRPPTLLLKTTGDLYFFSPTAAIDVNGDGEPEFLEEGHLVRKVGEGYMRIDLPEPYVEDC